MSASMHPISRRDFVKGTGAAAFGTLMASGSAFAQTPSPMSQRPNILFVLTDQWRAQAMGFSKQDPVSTPSLDAFHREALTFTNALACTPVCGPNRACLFTGRYPQNHGVLRNNAAAVRPEQLLSRVFKAGGYRTGYVGKWHLTGADAHRVYKGITPAHLRADYEYWTSAIHNHAHFDLDFDEQGERVDYGDGWQPDHVTRKAIQFMDQADDRPFNLVVSHGPPHNGNYHPGHCVEKRYTPGDLSHKENGYGYYAPAVYEALYQDLTPDDIRPNVKPIRQKGGDGFDTIAMAISGYYGACTALDASFGQLIDHLKRTERYDNTIVVFTSDHGEMMGSHGLMTKGVCFEESINVPLMIRVPGGHTTTSDLLFNSVDLMPTLVGLSGLEVPSGVDGRSFAPMLSDSNAGAVPEPDMAYIGLSQFRGWRTKRYTYVTTVAPSGTMTGREAMYLRDYRQTQSSHILFDLENDPYQQRPILHGDAAVTDAVIDDLHHALHVELKQRGDFIPETVA
ncbi:MAG: sulfatase-like hydrolase/transferase [Planctomycetota bacterium]